jgi:hypothetical protein
VSALGKVSRDAGQRVDVAIGRHRREENLHEFAPISQGARAVELFMPSTIVLL